MDGFPGEIILVFGGLALLMLGAALCDIINYIKEKAPEGRRRNKMQIFKKLLRSEEEKLGKAVMKYIDSLRKENTVLKNTNAYLKDDNCDVMHKLRILQKQYEDLQGEYRLLEEENKRKSQSLAYALHANGQLKRKYEGIGPGKENSIFTKKEGAVNA